MFHGDLKGVSVLFPRKGQPRNSLTSSQPNILIDGHGHAQVSDFGLASIAHGKYSTGVKSDKGHTVRWSAPEVLFGAVPASKQADVFAFGMVVVEVRRAATVREHRDARFQIPSRRFFFFVGVHWESSFPQYNIHGSFLQNYEWGTSPSSTRSGRIGPFRWLVEDDGVLLETRPEGSFENAGGC